MKDWMSELNDELKSSGVLDQYESQEAALQGLIDTKSMLGNSIRIPGEDASDDLKNEFANTLMSKVPGVMLKPDMNNEEQSANFYKTLGVPPTADKYKMPDGVNIPEQAESQFRESALAMNMTQSQFKTAIKNMSETMATSASEFDSKRDAITNKLRGEWGAALDERMSMAKKLHDANFKESMGIEFDDLDPSHIPGLYATAKALNGAGNQFGDQPPSEITVMTPGEAEMQISEMMGNKDHPYWHPEDGGHKAAQDKMLKLQAARAGRTDAEFMKPIAHG